ncbi:MAG: hypothetical protein ABJN65_17310 [Parasphingorhabdus sp.]
MTEGNPEASPSGFDLNKSTIIALLYLGGLIVGITGLIGFILAIIWKGEVEGTWEESHLQYHIMTFIIGFVVGIVGIVLSFILIGIPILIALFVWFIVRSIMPLLKAQKQEPMPDPKTFLF